MRGDGKGRPIENTGTLLGGKLGGGGPESKPCLGFHPGPGIFNAIRSVCSLAGVWNWCLSELELLGYYGIIRECRIVARTPRDIYYETTPRTVTSLPQSQAIAVDTRIIRFLILCEWP